MAGDPGSDVVVPLRSRRRARVVLAQKLQHVVPAPTLLLASATLGVGRPHGPLTARQSRRRSLRLTADALAIGHPLRTFTARWSDIASIDVTDRQAEIRTRSGRTRRLDLADLENAP